MTGNARKSHQLVDADRPNLVEETFPYSLPSLIGFEGKVTENIDGQSVEFDFGAVKDSDRIGKIRLHKLARWVICDENPVHLSKWHV